MSDELKVEGTKKILPDGIVRLKDAHGVPAPSSKKQEAMSNMGFFMVELDFRNKELESELARLVHINKQLRDDMAAEKQKAEQREQWRQEMVGELRKTQARLVVVIAGLVIVVVGLLILLAKVSY